MGSPAVADSGCFGRRGFGATVVAGAATGSETACAAFATAMGGAKGLAADWAAGLRMTDPATVRRSGNHSTVPAGIGRALPSGNAWGLAEMTSRISCFCSLRLPGATAAARLPTVSPDPTLSLKPGRIALPVIAADAGGISVEKWRAYKKVPGHWTRRTSSREGEETGASVLISTAVRAVFSLSVACFSRGTSGPGASASDPRDRQPSVIRSSGRDSRVATALSGSPWRESTVMRHRSTGSACTGNRVKNPAKAVIACHAIGGVIGLSTRLWTICCSISVHMHHMLWSAVYALV